MSSIEKRVRDGRVTWRAHYRTPEGRQRNKTFARKLDAERFLTTVESAKMTGSFVDPSRARVTVGEMAERWRAAKAGLAQSTQATYSAVLDDHVLPRWGDVALSAVEHEAVQEWVNELVGAGYSGAHVVKIHFALAGVLEVAVRGKRLQANPARGVALPRSDGKPKRYLTAAQVEDLAARAAELPAGRPRRRTDAAFGQYRLAVFVLAYCGLRWSELAGLRCSALNFRRRRITVAAAVVEVDGAGLVWKRPKSHEIRSIPMPRFLADMLREHVEGRDPGALVFTAPDGGVMRNRNARRAWFDRAASAAGVPGLTPHELRHTAASLAVSAGGHVKAVQRMLGHKSAKVTLDVYADLFDDDLETLADRLDELRARSGVAPVLPEALAGGGGSAS